jgi:hypothetical protein
MNVTVYVTKEEIEHAIRRVLLKNLLIPEEFDDPTYYGMPLGMKEPVKITWRKNHDIIVERLTPNDKDTKDKNGPDRTTD